MYSIASTSLVTQFQENQMDFLKNLEENNLATRKSLFCESFPSKWHFDFEFILTITFRFGISRFTK